MLEVVPLQAFKDNYIWTLRNATHAAVVDPGESGPVFEYLAREKLALCAILAVPAAQRSPGQGEELALSVLALENQAALGALAAPPAPASALSVA